MTAFRAILLVVELESLRQLTLGAMQKRIPAGHGEALVRTPLKELIEGLDEDVFWRVHRGVIINAHAIDRAVREGPEKLVVHIKGLKETLPVSRQYFHLFKQS